MMAKGWETDFRTESMKEGGSDGCKEKLAVDLVSSGEVCKEEEYRQYRGWMSYKLHGDLLHSQLIHRKGELMSGHEPAHDSKLFFQQHSPSFSATTTIK